jgi:hypothetical protein
MMLRKLGIALIVVVASMAIWVSAASARELLFEASSSAWYIGPSPGTKLTGTKVVQTVLDPETKISLTATIGGAKVTLDATGIKCVSCKAENSGTLALVKGNLKFTGMTLVSSELPNCSVPTTLETAALTATMGSVAATSRAPIRFAPTSGTSLGVVELTGTKCAVAGAYKMTGAFFGEGTNATEKFSNQLTFNFSQVLQEELGSAGSLKIAGNNAFLTAVVSKSLEPEVEFAVKPK